MLLTFNKLKQLTSSIQQIKESMKYSDVVEIDEQKNLIRKKTAADVAKPQDF